MKSSLKKNISSLLAWYAIVVGAEILMRRIDNFSSGLSSAQKANVEDASLDASHQESIAYRNQLINLEERMQGAYDKSITALSGGGIGISVAFLKDIVGSNHKQFIDILIYAWVLWSVSLIFVFISFYTSLKAIKKHREDCDAGRAFESNKFDRWTRWLNNGGGITCILGLLLALVFVCLNLKSK